MALHLSRCLALLLAVGRCPPALAALRGAGPDAARQLGGSLNGRWGLYANPWSSATVYADEICIRVVGGYAMKYNLWDTCSNRISPWSPTFSAQFTRVRARGRHSRCAGGPPDLPAHLREGLRGQLRAGRHPERHLQAGRRAGALHLVSDSTLNGMWGLYAAPWSSATVYADEICIRSVGGYAMQYNLWDTYSNRISPWSPTFSAQFTKCVPVADIRAAQEGHPISPRIFVKGYADSFVQVAIQSVIYKRGAGQARYTCQGSTTSWYCNRDA